MQIRIAFIEFVAFELHMQLQTFIGGITMSYIKNLKRFIFKHLNLFIQITIALFLLGHASYSYCSVFEEYFDDGNADGWNDMSTATKFCTPATSDPATTCAGISSADSYSAPYSLKLTVEANANDSGYPSFTFPAQSVSSWTHVRFYQKFEQGYVFGSQVKGYYLGSSSGNHVAKFQIRRYTTIPGYYTDSHWHYGFHTYSGGEQFISANNVGQEVYPDEQVGEWHCFEFAVQPSTRSLKLWIDGDLKMDLTNSDLVEDYSPSSLLISMYYGYDADGSRSPKTQSEYIDNIVISNSYIGPTGSSPPTSTTEISAPSAPTNLRISGD